MARIVHQKLEGGSALVAALGLLGPWLYSVWQNARARRAITGGEA